MKKKRIQFEWFWNGRHWYLLPAISLENFDSEFDICFHFMGFWFEIQIMKS